MLPRQAKLLQKQGENLLTQAESVNANEAIKLTELALKCFNESRGILHTLGANSVLLFAEFQIQLGVKFEYPYYLEFCTRNNLRSLSQQDYDVYMEEIMTTE